MQQMWLSPNSGYHQAWVTSRRLSLSLITSAKLKINSFHHYLSPMVLKLHREVLDDVIRENSL